MGVGNDNKHVRQKDGSGCAFIVYSNISACCPLSCGSSLWYFPAWHAPAETGGHFMLGTVDDTPYGTPPEDLKAVLEVVRETG